VSQYLAHHTRMNQRQAVAQYAARHSKFRRKQGDNPYVGRHALLTGKTVIRPETHRGGVLGRFLFMMLLLGGALSALTGSRGGAPARLAATDAGVRPRHRTGRYGTPDATATETTTRFRPVYK
jgi:hypothetical protein